VSEPGAVAAKPERALAVSRVPWWAWMIAGDAVLLGLMLFGRLLPRGWVTTHVLSFFALQHEMNVAAWWSGAQLFMGALFMYERASIGNPRERGAWAVLAVLSAGLSFDEIGSVHERLAYRSWRPLLFVAVPLGAAMAWALVRLARQPGRLLSVGLILAAYGLFAVVAGLEYLESVVGRIPRRGLGLELEEGLELVGFLLLLFAAIGRRPGRESGLLTVIPDPGRLAYLPALLTLGLAAYPVIAIAIVPHFTDLYMRGNPAVWYPSAVYGLLACQAVVARREAGRPRRRAWGHLGGLFLAASIGAVFPLVNLAPNIHLVLPRWIYSGAYGTYIFLILPVLLIAPRVVRRSRLVGVAAVLAIFLLVRLATPDQRLDDIAAGLVAYLYRRLYLARGAGWRAPAGSPAAAAPTSA
jgi:hypothetical protein